MSFQQIQTIRPKKRQHSPEFLKIVDKRICDEPVNPLTIEDQDMNEINNSFSSCIILDDYTEDELNELFPIWMQPPVVNIDTLLFK